MYYYSLIVVLFSSIFVVFFEFLGTTNGQDRIVDGQIATPGQFPWQISLQDVKNGHICGGSIISNNTVLTAAHYVVENGNPAPVDTLSVVAGEYSLSKNDGTEQKVGVTKLIVHPNYSESANRNDLALLRVSQNFDLNGKSVAAIRMANYMEQWNQLNLANASGWGSITDEDGNSPDLLHWTRFQIRQPPPSDSPEQICAKGVKASNICPGDSGGPLVCQDFGGNSFLCGVSQYIGRSPDGPKECTNATACFQNVSYQRNWINTAMRNL